MGVDALGNHSGDVGFIAGDVFYDARDRCDGGDNLEFLRGWSLTSVFFFFTARGQAETVDGQ
jgi:hypothetical protein